MQLKGCETDVEVTGLSLGQLALLYGWLGYGDFNSPEERAQKIYGLYFSSAMKGNDDSILTMIQIFENGEPLISLVAERDKAFCLRALVDSGDYTLQQINDCLGSNL